MNIDWLIWFASLISTWEDLVNKNASFADFVRFRPYTYARTQQFLPPLWAAINYTHCDFDPVLSNYVPAAI